MQSGVGWWLLGALALTARSASFEPTPRFPKGLAPMQVGAAPHGLESWDPEGCASCHAREVDAWKLSAHREARSGAFFQASLAKENPAWCVGCHAPQATAFTRGGPPADAPATEHGVACAACHSGRTRESLKNPDLCAGCHQFGFTVRDARGRLLRLSQQPQQDTWGEWDRWRTATGDARTCVDCHMPGGDHSMGGRRFLDLLRSSLVVEVAQPRTLVVTTSGAGHRVPTGDVMRWMGVEAAADPLFEEPVTLATFGRRLGMGGRPPEPLPYFGLVENTTLPASGTGEPVRIVVPERDASGRPLVAWRAVYHLVSAEQESDGRIPTGATRFVLAAGFVEEAR